MTLPGAAPALPGELRMNILLTGFEAFGGESINPAWEVVQRLQGERIAGHAIHARQLPCAFGASIQELEKQIAELRPAIVLALGQASGRTGLELERIAINVDDARIPDNTGRQPIDEPVIAGGPAAYFSGLPIKAIVQALRAAGLPAGVSQSAGTFVCNHLFYGMMHLAANQDVTKATRHPGMRCGFMHIPLLPEQAARQPGSASMALPLMVEGVRVVLQTALAHEQDIRLGMGQIQ
jgi:pyroglutamyl-peptidase